MAVSKKEDGKWSEGKMEEDDGLRTLECLRGRLLAERQASRIAREDAELMGSKLVELENKLREETKLRNRAEKRLKFLKKKVESLKIMPVLKESEQSSSSEKSVFSCLSSVGESESNTPEKPEENASETTKSTQALEWSSNEDNAGPHSCSESDTKDLIHEKSRENSKIDDKSDPRLRSSTEVKDDKIDDHVDNSLALVPVSPPEKNSSPEIKIVNKNVMEVLDTLRHIRERIQSTMESRRVMIRVGPA